ncbi:MAG: ECF transporter S component [Clostridiales bacterium]|nr:ECF transporter S component [Clostridiales bacterium]
MKNLNELMNLASSNLGFLLISIAIIAVILSSAYGAEIIIAKKHNNPMKKENCSIKRMIIIAMMSAIAVILMLFEFPIGFIPGFYKLDFSEIPVIIGAFTLGPVAGLMIELIKIILNLMIHGTSSAFVGEFANFLIGSAFIIPASFFYFLQKNKRNAIVGLSIGTVVATVTGGILNAFVLLPKYAQLMGPDMSMNYGETMEFIIGEGTKVNSAIHGMSSFVLFGVTPFNLIKYGIVSIVTIFIYKKISHILKVGNR